MYLLNCSDFYYHNTLKKILVNQFSKFITIGNKPYFSELYISAQDKKLIISLDQKKLLVDLPMSLNNFLNSIIDIISEHSIKFNEILYFPYQQKLCHEDKVLQLGNIHNQIIQQLLLNLENGIDKRLLYSMAWPSDKTIMANKLDTHLTNLKNLIEERLNLKILFISKSGNLKLTN